MYKGNNGKGGVITGGVILPVSFPKILSAHEQDEVREEVQDV